MKLNQLNYLNLNDSKTEVIWFGAPNTQSSFDLGELTPFCKSVVKNHGVKFDSYLKFDTQINSVVKSCFFLKLALEKIIHAFIFVWLDYCNSLYIGVRLQLLQNAARLLTGTRKKKKEHGTLILTSLHWLDITWLHYI